MQCFILIAEALAGELFSNAAARYYGGFKNEGGSESILRRIPHILFPVKQKLPCCADVADAVAGYIEEAACFE
jgi:hypothetical protein